MFKRLKKTCKMLKKRARRISYFQRASLDKLVREKIKVLKRTHEGGNFNEGLVTKRAPAPGRIIPTDSLEGEISTKNEIQKHLMDDKVGMIGVCGIGGVGKTTIMKHINNDLLREDTFQKVIWVTVSYPLNVFALQKKIADAMHKTLQEDEEEMMRAATLMDIMGRVSFVLILDDVWEKFSLKDVGIPEPVQNKSKVVITSRSFDVCNYLDCKIVKVQPLSQEESLNLFLDKVGHDVLQKVPGLGETLNLIVKECAGLPLAIVVIAGSMKGVDEIELWRNALTELQECVESVKGSADKIFMILKFSFDRLPNVKIKNCFLYCSLFREDYSFEREELIEGWIDEGLMDGLRSRKAAYDRGHAALDMLEKNSLLEKHQREENQREEIKMHDIVRDMAIKSIGPGVGYMVKTGMKLTEVPNEHEWARDLMKVSLMTNDISKIPIGLTPKCPTLSTLILSDNPLTEIPESFFEDMSGLKVLDLSRTKIEVLPCSISKLEYLSTLRLRMCKRLKCLPSLEKLVALKKLDLRWAGIEVVPQGMEMLVNLEYLDLTCGDLKEIPTGILSKLSCLQYLMVIDIRGRHIEINLNLEEVARLRKLEILECKLDDMQDFNYFLSEFKNFGSFIAYELLVGTTISYTFDFQNPQHKRRLIIDGCDIGEDCIVLPDNLQHLRIHNCKNIRSSLNKTALLENATELGLCVISDCEETEYVVELSSFSSCSPVLDKLEDLYLRDLPRLWALVRVEGVATPPHVFSNLKRLDIWGCSGMRKLLPLELLQALQNLEVIYVHTCEQMEEIITSSDSDVSSSDKFTFTFPKLRKLCLLWLPQLKSICSANGVMVCDSIEEIWMTECPKLKRIPVQLPLLDNGQPSPPPRLKLCIYKKSKEWWESVVEWDHPNAKNILQPFLKIF